MRPVLAVLLVLTFAAIAVAATTAGRASKAPSDAVNTAPRATADPAETARAEVDHALGSSPGQGRGISPVVRGLMIPIEGADIPTAPELLPNSPREYRAGWHEGIDFPADRGTTVRAAASGTVVRVDRDFVDWDPAALADLHVGETVTRGQVIGTVGSSGFEGGGPHLHLEVRIGDDYLGDWLEG